jgi:hypothetical protein
MKTRPVPHISFMGSSLSIINASLLKSDATVFMPRMGVANLAIKDKPVIGIGQKLLVKDDLN